MEKKIRLLLVEDDQSFGGVLRDFLVLNKFEVSWVEDGMQGWNAFKNSAYDLGILDVMMPKKDGFSLGREILKENREFPIIFLTAKSMKPDIVEGFKLGAIDYITKPFDAEVLLLRIDAALRKLHGKDSNITHFQLGDLEFNAERRTLNLGKKSIRLSPKENELLRLLCLNKGEIVERESALKKIWSEDNYFTARSMDVYITKLRKLLRDDPEIRIENIHGKGFILNFPEESKKA